MKVLLVDDSKSARFTLNAVLKKHHLEVKMVESGEEALEYLSKNSVDLVFMDHFMPGMSGIKATQEIKKNSSTQHIPIILCTSNEGAEYERNARDAGAIGVLSKPPKPAMLEAMLQQLEAQFSAKTVAVRITEDEDIALINQQLDQTHTEQQVLDKIIPMMHDRVTALVATEVETALAQLLENTVKPMIRQQIGDLDKQISDAMNDAGYSVALKKLEKRLKTDLETYQGRILAMIDTNSSTVDLVSQQEFGELQSRLESLDEKLNELPDDLKISIGQTVFNESGRVINAQIANMKTYFNNQRNGENNELMSRVNTMLTSVESNISKKVYIITGVLAAAVIAALVMSFM